MRSRPFLAPLVALLAAAGCDETFTPIEANDLKFSVFGYLDASADTQWIRVMPLRTLVTTSPEPLGARVTLEDLRTGRVIEMRDSVFQFDAPSEVGGPGRFFHNFWTAERLEPGASYRFSAVPDGGEPSRAEVVISPDYDTEVWIGQGQGSATDFLRLSGLRHVAFVAATAFFYDDCGDFSQRTLSAYTSAEGDVQLVPVLARVQARTGCGTPVVERRELWVAGSGAPWPSGRAFQSNRLGGVGDTASISGSVGFLGGVLTKVVPYESCQLLGVATLPEPCRLRYDEASATLRGSARDRTCDLRPIPRLDVRLRELDPPPGARAKLRTMLSNRAGDFEIGALEAGKRYVLTMHRLHPAFRYHQFHEFVDTLVFAPGQRLVYDAELTGIEPCEDTSS